MNKKICDVDFLYYGNGFLIFHEINFSSSSSFSRI